MRLQTILAVFVILTLALSGCANSKESTEVPTLETTCATEENTHPSVLEDVELTLPDFIVRQSASESSDYFYKESEIVGGIELLNIASQMDTMDTGEYAEQAINVTKAVYNTEYDYMVEDDASCHTIVSVSSKDGREFYHYFFSGKQMGYDIWMDNSVMDTRDMRSCLKTLHAKDLYNPQDYAIVNEETPLLNLRMTLPDGITWQPKMTTRGLLYIEETLAGGIEQLTASADLDTLGKAAVNLTEELYGGEFSYTSTGHESGTPIIAEICTENADTHIVHYILNVGTECYDVWADTAVISEKDALDIAQSCQY